jgi:hypothetical protein
VRVEDIEVHAGEPDRPYRVLGPIKAWVSGRAIWAATPSIETGNSKLRETALKMGANGVIHTTYGHGPVGLGKGYHVLYMTGTAVVFESDTVKCPYCAELIKREALICRFCGRDVADDGSEEADEGRAYFARLEAKLSRATRGWTASEVVRTYKRGPDGDEDYEDDATVFEGHGYVGSAERDGPTLTATFRIDARR